VGEKGYARQLFMHLIVGAESEIGGAVLRHMAGAAIGTTRRPDRVAADRLLLDLSRPLGDWRAPAGTVSACLCAAIGRVADCAADPAGSGFVNVEQTVALAERLAAQGIHVLFLSTNQVFDGEVAQVAPDTPPAPVSEYGRQKARAEAALLRLLDGGAPIGILRLAKVVSPGIALLRSWAESLGAGRPIRAFADMVMAPSPVDLVAAAIAALLRERACGIFQLSGPEDVTYAEIGRHIARRLGVSEALVEPVSAGMPAGSTPRHTTMDSALIRQRFGIEVPGPWAVIDAALGFTP
jgi:dTDP-4-dehydrorhamnose reductase